MRYQFRTTIVHARDFRMHTSPGGLILVGHKKGNPWIELFEPRMNFHYDCMRRGGEVRAVLVNQDPREGEQKSYVAEYEKHGYALLAYLPKPLGEGDALIISGTDMSSIEAGVQFATREKHVAGLLELLGAQAGDRLPYFEVLLRTKLLLNTAPGFEVIAHRIAEG